MRSFSTNILSYGVCNCHNYFELSFIQSHQTWSTYATGTLLLSVMGTFVRLRVLPDLPGIPISLISRLIGGVAVWASLGRLPNPNSAGHSGDCFRFRDRGEPLVDEGDLCSLFALAVVLAGDLLSSCDRLRLQFISWYFDSRSPAVEQRGSFRLGLASGIIGETGEAGYILVLEYFSLTSRLGFFAIVQNLWEGFPMIIKGRAEEVREWLLTRTQEQVRRPSDSWFVRQGSVASTPLCTSRKVPLFNCRTVALLNGLCDMMLRRPLFVL